MMQNKSLMVAGLTIIYFVLAALSPGVFAEPQDNVGWEGVNVVAVHLPACEADGDWMDCPVTIVGYMTGPSVTGLFTSDLEARMNLLTDEFTFDGTQTCHECTLIVDAATVEGTFHKHVQGGGTTQAASIEWSVTSGTGALEDLCGAGSGDLLTVVPFVQTTEWTGFMDLTGDC